MNWVSSQTRPDVAYYVCEVSVSIKDVIINDLIQGNKHIGKLKTENLSVKIVDLKDLEKCSIVCFSGVSFANLKGNSSQGGFITSLWKFRSEYRNEKLFSPIAWKSIKIKHVVKRAIAAETLALEQALEACFIMKLFFYEMLNKKISNGYWQ